MKITSGIHIGDTFDDIEDAVKQGIRSSRYPLRRELENVAKGRLIQVGAVWKPELINSFDAKYSREGNTYTIVFQNDADHAPPIEYGAEYDEEGPPVAALIPWVQDKLHGFTVTEDFALPDPPDIDQIREQAREEATNQNMIDAVSLADPNTVRKAFWLQQHIKEEGIDAVRFMRAAEKWAEKHADETVAAYINIELGKL